MILVPELNHETAMEVYIDDDVKYGVMLNFVDIISNKNSYFKLEILTEKPTNIKYFGSFAIRTRSGTFDNSNSA